MSCRVLEGNNGISVLYCSSSEWAFGPLFTSADDAEDFKDYVREHPDRKLVDPDTRFLGEDPREYTESGLRTMHARWQNSRAPRIRRATQKFEVVPY